MLTFAHRLLREIRFSEKRIHRVLPRLVVKSFDEGEVIWEKGQPVQSWNCIISGHVAATVPLERGDTMPVHVYSQQAWFGEQSMLNNQPSHLQYTCLSPVEVIGMCRNSLDEALAQEPEFVRFLVSLVAWRVQQHSEMLMLMRLGSSSLRVVMGLAQFAEALSCRDAGPPAVERDGVVDIPISQELLAALCGLSRTLFSEYLQHLVRAGWVTVRYGGLALRSSDAWRAFARRQRERQRMARRPSIADLLGELCLAQAEVMARAVSPSAGPLLPPASGLGGPSHAPTAAAAAG